MAGVRLVKSNLPEIKKRMEEASKPQSVTLGELLTDEFMQEKTGFESLHALLVAAGLDLDAIEGWEDLDTDVLNEFVRENTPFSGFLEIRNAAIAERLGRQIFGK